mgnify:CR=1 FL=1
MKAELAQVAELLRRAGLVAVLSGAGASKESGIPTFREAQTGLWARYDPGQLATPAAFRTDPQLVWDWYEYRRGLVRGAAPNPGHYALADLEALDAFTDPDDRAGSAGVRAALPGAARPVPRPLARQRIQVLPRPDRRGRW